MRGWVAGGFVLITACGGITTSSAPATNDAASLHACSPLTEGAAAITLATVVAAGRHADSTLYVIDHGSGSDYRAFVSQGGGLQRVEVTGSGTTPDDITLMTADFTLRALLANDAATKMGVVRGALKDREKTFEIGAEGDVLQLVGPEAYRDLAVTNIQEGTVVEFDATSADGHRLFVIHPGVDFTYEDFRVFYGTKAAMLEREVISVSRTLSIPSTTLIAFTVDGIRYDATLGAAPGTLTFGGTSQGLSVAETNSAGSGVGLTFECR